MAETRNRLPRLCRIPCTDIRSMQPRTSSVHHSVICKSSFLFPQYGIGEPLSLLTVCIEYAVCADIQRKTERNGAVVAFDNHSCCRWGQVDRGRNISAHRKGMVPVSRFLHPWICLHSRCGRNAPSIVCRP